MAPRDKEEAPATFAPRATAAPRYLVFDGIEPGSFHVSDVVDDKGNVRGERRFEAGSIALLADVPDSERCIALGYARIASAAEVKADADAKAAAAEAAKAKE